MGSFSFSNYHITVTCIDISNKREYAFSFIKGQKEINHCEISFTSIENLVSTYAKYVDANHLEKFARRQCTINLISDRYFVQNIFFPSYNYLKNKKITENAFKDTFEKNYNLVAKTDVRNFRINKKYGASLGLIKKDLLNNVEVEMKTLGLKIVKINNTIDLAYRAISKIDNETGAIVISTAKYYISGFIIDKILVNMNVISRANSSMIKMFLVGYVNEVNQKFGIKSLDVINLFSEYTDFNETAINVLTINKYRINSDLSQIKKLKAFTIIETVVALAIFAISLTGLLSGLILTSRLAKKNNERALLINSMDKILTAFSNGYPLDDNVYYLTYTEPDVFLENVDFKADASFTTFTLDLNTKDIRFSNIFSLNYFSVTMADFTIAGLR